MTLPLKQHYAMSWNRTEISPCYISKAQNIADIRQTLTTASTQGLSVIPHGTGHSYTDAALNTNGILIDVTGMRRILSWNPEHGIIQVEPGVTLREMLRITFPDRWWPIVTPSTADVTIGGCVAMNVNGKNAWKCGSFGEHILSLTVLLANGQMLTLSPASNLRLFQALVGSVGLLGVITSITLQLQRLKSESVDILIRPASSLGEIFTIFQEEQSADFLEAWVDGFASGPNLGRGVITASKYSHKYDNDSRHTHITHKPGQLNSKIAHCAGKLGRPTVKGSAYITNNIMYWGSKWGERRLRQQRSLFHFTYYPPAAFTGYQALLPHGTETFQAFVPHGQAEMLFKEIVQRSQQNKFIPLWCIIKQHRQDPFLLSYQVDGFSLEVNYQIVPRTAPDLYRLLRELIELVIEAGGRFYFAKDSLLTDDLYRRSVGDATIKTFLQLKELYDPEMLFQSNLFRRVFPSSPQ